MHKVMLVLDLDDTIIPSMSHGTELKRQIQIVHELLDFCDINNIEYGINTARTYPSLNGVDRSLQQRLKDVPYCFRPHKKSIPETKKKCMLLFAKNRPKTNLILMDDKKKNCECVEQSNFKTIHVTPNGKGITKKDIDTFKQKFWDLA